MNEGDTIFHKIIRKEIPADIVYEDERCLAFRDINPVSPVHLLIVPRESIAGLQEMKPEHKELMGHLLFVAGELARREGTEEKGYRVVINAGAAGGQTVFQLHVHLVGGRDFTWPPG